jgi:hypothetical protein
VRYVNRVLAAVLSVALIAAGALLIIEVIAARLGSAPVLIPWPDAYVWGNDTTWDEAVIRVICITMSVVGAVLLVFELKRPRVRRLAVAGEPEGVDIAYTRSGVARAVQGAATGVDGIRSASVRVARRSVRLTALSASTETRAAKSLLDPVSRAAQQQIDELRLDPTPRLAVSMRATKR